MNTMVLGYVESHFSTQRKKACVTLGVKLFRYLAKMKKGSRKLYSQKVLIRTPKNKMIYNLTHEAEKLLKKMKLRMV